MKNLMMMNIYMIIKFIFDERMNCVSINESEEWEEDDDEIELIEMNNWIWVTKYERLEMSDWKWRDDWRWNKYK